MKYFKWQHIQFTDGSNPYICTIQKEFNRMKRKYKLTQMKDGFWLAGGEIVHENLHSRKKQP